LSNNLNFEQINKKPAWASAWMFLLIFGGYILFVCVAAAFCGVQLWAVGYDHMLASSRDIVAEVNENPEWELLIDEEFNDNINDWDLDPYEGDGLTLNRKIEDGLFIWSYQSAKGWYFWDFPGSVPTVSDFVVTVEIRHTTGNLEEEFGLILRASDEDYYFLEVMESGVVLFRFHTEDNYETLLEDFNAPVKIGEPNLISVKASGNHFVFYVNNEFIGEVEDERLERGYVGIFTSTNGEPGSFFQPLPIAFDANSNAVQQTYPSRYEVDNFKIWVPVYVPAELDELSPHEGRLVYVSDQDGNPEIYTIHTDGTDTTRLTNNDVDDLSPKWSFDGGRIAFVSTRDGNPEIYTMNENGTDVTRITRNAADDLDPSWSPDGKNVIFSSNRDGNYELYIYNLETKKDERLTENSSDDRYPDWSANGEMILYQSEQYGVAALYTHELSTKEDTRLTPRLAPYGHSNADFSTSGSSIVYTTGHTKNQTGIMIYHLDTKTSVDVVLGSVNQSIYSVANLYPTWSEDDTQIAFTSDRGPQTDIYIISSDGKYIFRVTETEAVEWDLDWTEK
jgi:WD40 repeat protein